MCYNTKTKGVKMSEKMEKKIMIPMTEAQHKEIKAKADDMGVAVTAYMRLMALQGELKKRRR